MIRTIWIEDEERARSPRPGVSDTNSDVFVTMFDGSRWSATFFTFANIATLRKRWAENGECLHGRYFWAKTPVLVSKITRSEVEEVVKDLIATGEFEQAFERVTNEGE